MSNKIEMKKYRNSVLFITYDGLLDPLGASQILPYLYSIAEHPRHLHIISFEKTNRFKSGADTLRYALQEKGIGWSPLSFTSRMGKLGKVWDLLRMYATALALQLRYKFGIIHCRSYQAMQVGCFLKRFTRVKTIFDTRGLWVDDRIDRNIWPQDKLLYRLLYKYYKRVERKLIKCADSVVVLTKRMVPEIRKLTPQAYASISIIPCCADFDHFSNLSEAEKQAVRAELKIDKKALVLSYLGSLGTLYLFDDMLNLFESLVKKRDDVHLLFITRDWTNEHEDILVKKGLANLRDRIHVKSAARDEVPLLLGASDIMMNFIRPTYSMMACSPTKFAESLAIGIPTISSSGVGDVDAITQDLDAGVVIDLNDPRVFDSVTEDINSILAKGGEGLRVRARKHLGLENAKRAYKKLYEDLESPG
ncbi:glycosyltransferase [Pistricoccus aurantiacus]|uniref:glycosyltransferase n=1 Tax=Pistricoccus aurantiacus TaxID=1883414 RepID=UPI00362CF179